MSPQSSADVVPRAYPECLPTEGGSNVYVCSLCGDALATGYSALAPVWRRLRLHLASCSTSASYQGDEVYAPICDGELQGFVWYD